MHQYQIAVSVAEGRNFAKEVLKYLVGTIISSIGRLLSDRAITFGS
jgi:hypothetical protein